MLVHIQLYTYIYRYYAKTCIQLLLKQQNLGLQSLVTLAIFAGLWDQDPKAARPAGFCCLWADLFMGTPQNGHSNREDNGRPLISGKSRVENWVPWTHKWLLILVENHQFLVADHVERFPVCHKKGNIKPMWLGCHISFLRVDSTTEATRLDPNKSC